jgi:hypothetical protein
VGGHGVERRALGGAVGGCRARGHGVRRRGKDEVRTRTRHGRATPGPALWAHRGGRPALFSVMVRPTPTARIPPGVAASRTIPPSGPSVRSRTGSWGPFALGPTAIPRARWPSGAASPPLNRAKAQRGSRDRSVTRAAVDP